MRRGYRTQRVPLEVDAGDVKVPMFHVFRDAASRSVRQLHDEMRDAQAARAGLDLRRRQIRLVRWIPKPVRGLMWRALGRAPKTWRKNGGTVVLTSASARCSRRAGSWHGSTSRCR